jgi:hypothetical protein
LRSSRRLWLPTWCNCAVRSSIPPCSDTYRHRRASAAIYSFHAIILNRPGRSSTLPTCGSVFVSLLLTRNTAPPSRAVRGNSRRVRIRVRNDARAIGIVMAGLDPWAFSPRACPVGIHVLATGAGDAGNPVDARVKPAHDDLRLVPIKGQQPLPVPWTALRDRGRGREWGSGTKDPPAVPAGRISWTLYAAVRT